MIMTSRLEQAIRTAAVAHQLQTRKGSDIPYIIHPFSVMCIASQATNDEDILIACLLHDVLEDVSERYSEAQLMRDFGDRVHRIVLGVTNVNKSPSWHKRAEAYLEHLEQAQDASLLVSAADKIHNMMSTLADHTTMGDGVWAKFNAGKLDQQWWYRAVYKVITKRLPDLPLNGQMEKLVLQIEAL